MLYLLLRRWSIIFELFSRKFLINGKHSCSFSAAPTPKSVSRPGQSRRAPNDIRDLPSFVPFLRPNIQKFIPVGFSNKMTLSRKSRGRGRGCVVTGGNFVCLVAGKGKLFGFFCYHSGEDFGLSC